MATPASSRPTCPPASQHGHDSKLVPKINYHAMHALNELKKKNNGPWLHMRYDGTVGNLCVFCYIIDFSYCLSNFHIRHPICKLREVTIRMKK
jgi:hypothetical protein